MPSDTQRHDLLIELPHEGSYIRIEELLERRERVLLHPLDALFVLFFFILDFDIVTLLHVLGSH